jgi:hypothetical protein
LLFNFTALNLDPKNSAAQEGLQKIEQSTDGPHDGGAGPNVSVGGSGPAGYDLDMDDINSEGEEEEEEEEGAAADDLEESETEAVWSDGDLNLSANNF